MTAHDVLAQVKRSSVADAISAEPACAVSAITTYRNQPIQEMT